MNEELSKQLEVAKAEAGIKAEEAPAPEVVEVPAEQTIEEKAISMGWKPDHKGPGFVSAEEFVARGSFFRKIEAQNKELRELKDVVKRLDEHNRKIADASYKKGVEDTIIQRTQAIENGDIAAFNRAEAELKRLETVKPVEVKPAAPETTQDMIDWAEQNKTWFNNSSPKNMRMVKEADGLFTLEKMDNPGLSDKEILEVVTEKMARLHPEVFTNPNKERAPAITQAKATSVGGKASLASKLSPRQKEMFDKATRAGLTLSVEEYAKQLELTGDLRND